mmetsp:Transcript_46693/g.110721  ORF Transcript_46693/g.110721 Transcript_46693/m.110721 type:complete len:605 (-) Transcript_46693:126-1940(-)
MAAAVSQMLRPLLLLILFVGSNSWSFFTAPAHDTATLSKSFQRNGAFSSLRKPLAARPRICAAKCTLLDPPTAEDEDDILVPPKYEGTIYAQSTPIGVGGIAVLRVSGTDALAALARLSKPGLAAPKPRTAALRSVIDPATGDVLDRALVLYFPGPKSFTGEDIVEFHVHGGIAIVNSVMAALSNVAGLRLAERGEFTKRAFLNGRMDLLEAEALNDLIHAETSGQQKQAMKQMSGTHKRLYQRWRTDILRCLAHVNAFIDYGESDGLVEEEVLVPVHGDASRVMREMKSHLADGRRGETIRSGLRCTLVGPPNAGKSSLLNVLAARPAAIVSAVPGTTRDIVQVRLELGGLPVLVDDTAGLRVAASDEIEEEGMRRSAASFKEADVRVLVLDGSALARAEGEQLEVVELLESMLEEDEGLEEWDVGKETAGNWRWSEQNSPYEEEEEEEEGEQKQEAKELLVVLNKLDLCREGGAGEAEQKELISRLKPVLESAMGTESVNFHWLSCESREGVDSFLEALSGVVRESTEHGNDDDAPLITRQRHRELIRRANAALGRFIDSQYPIDIQAEELGIALDALGKIYGEVDVEEMLDVVFRDFCIGK